METVVARPRRFVDSISALNAEHPGIAPLTAGVSAAGFCGFMGVVDPVGTRGYPLCPFRATTGLWCPGCGMARCLHAFFNGQFGAAAGYNIWVFALIPVLFYAYLGWTGGRLKKWCWPSMPTLGPSGAIAISVALIVFGVARNLPFELTQTLAP